jgi:hypothetical protein
MMAPTCISEAAFSSYMGLAYLCVAGGLFAGWFGLATKTVTEIIKYAFIHGGLKVGK